MKCVICKIGKTTPGKTTFTLERGESVLVIRNVPRDVCQDCGEAYLDEDQTDRVMQLAEKAFNLGHPVKVSIISRVMEILGGFETRPYQPISTFFVGATPRGCPFLLSIWLSASPTG